MYGVKSLEPRRLRTVVTGCSGALGGKLVEALSSRGDHIIGLDRVVPNEPELEFLQVELTDDVAVTETVNKAASILGGIDVLIHAAAIMHKAPFMETTSQDMTRHFDVNVMGAFRMCQAVARHMNGDGGRIVLISSIHGTVGVPHRAAYAASKGAVEAMGRVIAAELGPHRIRVNILAPGAIDGGIPGSSNSRQYWVEATPVKRVASLEEVARTAMFLASDDASFINGQTITIDGGASIVKLIRENDQVA